MELSTTYNRKCDVLHNVGLIAHVLFTLLISHPSAIEASSMGVGHRGGGSGLVVPNPNLSGNCDVLMNGGLPYPQPVILQGSTTRQDGFAFKRPAGGGGYLRFAHGENVRLVCTGTGNYFFYFGNPRNPVSDIIVSCQHTTYFNYMGNLYPFQNFECVEDAHNATRVTSSPSCRRNREQFIEIGFQITTRHFIKLIEVCFDTYNLKTLWTKFDMVAEIHGQEVGFQRGRFRPGPHFPMPNADNYYLGITQRANIQHIIGQANAVRYIALTGNSYLSRGHLVAVSDFLYTIQKACTFYLVNVAPQWQGFNAGTWNQLEIEVRFLAHQSAANFVVYTGIHGSGTLPDTCNVEKPLYLNVNVHTGRSRIPVPAVYWKVVYNPQTQQGVALVGINNQHRTWNQVMASPGFDLCPGRHRTSTYWSICSASTAPQTQGFGYCCSVNDFRSIVNYIPLFTVTGFLQ